MSIYDRWNVYFGDLHNHCDISYGHGSLQEAVQNAREQLDFCSVTGHADWPDMPDPNARIADIIEFHNTGFNRLRERWADVRQTMQEANEDESFLTFLSYEIHSNKYGDYTIVFRDLQGQIVYTSGIPKLKQQLRELTNQDGDFLAIPHHIGYLRGFRGLNWDTFSSEFSPIIELFSMHGCSEDGETARPFLHAMGPSDWQSTMQHGLQQGNIFGVIGSTDHHSAHPGSYGHGRAAVWARSLSRQAVWEALVERRTYALTGDRIGLEFSLNGQPMGSVIPFEEIREIEAKVNGGGAIDYVDIIKDNALLRRYSGFDPIPGAGGRRMHTKVAVEVGWGRRGRRFEWNVSLRAPEAEILSVEPRFRGREVLSPRDVASADTTYYESHWERTREDTVSFKTVTYGNPNTLTPATQGLCLEVKIPLDAKIEIETNGSRIKIPVNRLVEGPKAGYVFDEPSSPAWRIERLPLPHQFKWQFEFEDKVSSAIKPSYYYLRIRQKNGQWAWSSPIFVPVA